MPVIRDQVIVSCVWQIVAQRAAAQSARQPKNHKESPIQLLRRFEVEPTNDSPNPITSQGNHLVRHDL